VAFGDGHPCCRGGDTFKSCQRLPTLRLLAGAIVKEKGQPIEGREGSETWDKVVRKEERGWREWTRG